MTLADDETPVNTIEDDSPGGRRAGRVRGGRLIRNRVHPALRGPGVAGGRGTPWGHVPWAGPSACSSGTPAPWSPTIPNGYPPKYQVRLTARQLCNAHLIRSAKGVAEAEPRLQAWAAAMIEVLRAGRKSVTDARAAAGLSALTARSIQQIRAAYREQAQAGITANLGRRTSKGDKHPAWVLALALVRQDRPGTAPPDRLHRALDLEPRRTGTTPRQNPPEDLRLLPLPGNTRAYCRIHSYLITIRLNAVPPMQAIRDALAGHPWTPLRALTTA